MRKGIKAAAAVLIYIVLLWYCIPGQLPEFENIIPEVELGQGGNLILAENKEQTIAVYETSPQGMVGKTYVRHRGEERIVNMAYEGRVYFLTYQEMAGGRQYRVYGLSENWKAAEELCSFNRTADIFLMDFTVKDKVIYLTEIENFDATLKVEQFDLNSSSPKMETAESAKLPDGYPVMAVYTGDTLCALSNKGSSFYYKEGGALTLEEDNISWLEESGGKAVYYNLDQGQGYYREAQEGLEVSLANAADAQAVAIDAAGGSQTVLHGGGSRVLSVKNPEGEYQITGLKTTAAVKGNLMGMTFLAITVAYGLLLGLIFLVLYLLKRQRMIALKLIVVVLLFDFTFVALLTGFIYRNNKDLNGQNRFTNAAIYANLSLEDVNAKIHLQDIEPENFADTEYFDIFYKILNSWLNYDDLGNEILYSQALMYRDGQEAYILESNEYAYGRDIEGIYSSGLVENIHGMEDGSEYIAMMETENTVPYVYLIYPVKEAADNRLFLVVRGSINGIHEQNMRLLIKSIQISAGCGLIMAAVLLLIIYVMLRPIRRLCSAMGRVAGGNYELPEVLYPDNELGDMWIYLHKMCKALKLQHYSKENVLNYFYRFAPKRFETLFGKEKLQEVAIGETAMVEGTLGMISVAQKEQFLKSSEPGEYIRQVNQLLDIISEQKARGDGVLLSNDSNLESLKILYRREKGSADAALRFGIESICALEAWDDKGTGITPFALLHTARFICGLAGTSEQAYPFATSLEMERLESYTENFKHAGIKLIITEPTKEKLQEKYDIRYIGYLDFAEEGFHFPVYEVLEVYTQQEKNGKLKADEKFQKALRLFYDSNFYPARNCFMEVLKLCPQDGVAKWYLFRCEELFQGRDEQNIQYHLF